MDFFVKIFTSIILLGFPLYFWGYIFSLLGGENKGIRLKFFAGIFLGLFSVGIIFLLTKFFQENNFLIFFIIGAILLIFSVLIVLIFTFFGSKIPKKFLRKISIFHSILIFVGLLFFSIFTAFFTNNLSFLAILVPIIFAAFFEEISKHFTMLALMGKYFSFSLRELTIFAFCIVLGFVFIENIFYLYNFGFSFTTAVSRSIFSFSAHLLSALIAVIFWWKSLSYRIFSIGYIFWFSFGIALSVLIHSFYNLALQNNFNFLIIIYLISAYFLFIYCFNKKSH